MVPLFDYINIASLQVFEDEEHGALARVEVGQVQIHHVAPQVATEFVYEPKNGE